MFHVKDNDSVQHDAILLFPLAASAELSVHSVRLVTTRGSKSYNETFHVLSFAPKQIFWAGID
jgi:hypothetical protein